MIARPVHRPLPIPFDTPSACHDNGRTRAVSWAANLGPGAQAGGIPHVAPRLSPVRVSLSAATHASAPSASATMQQHQQPAKRTMHAVNGSATAHQAHVGGPRKQNGHGTNPMTEISARYIGQGALSVRSSVTGRHYRFQGHGDSLVIDRNDVVLLKRISDLVIR